MKTGATIGILRDEQDPAKSENTDLVAAWITFGGRLVQSGGFQHAMDGDRRWVQWLIDEDVKAVVDGAQMDWDTFRARFADQRWCEANPGSQITAARAFRDNARDLKRFAKTVGIGVMKRDARGHGIIYPDSPDWLKREFAARFLA
jgi:hypothetical protein